MKIALLLLLLVVASPGSGKQSDEQDMTKETITNADLPLQNNMMKLMTLSANRTNDLAITGDFDFDYANNMIIHHQMAINMSTVEIEKGKDQKIVNIAKGIVAAQTIEIRALQQFLKNYIRLKNDNQSSNSDKITLEMKQMMSQIETQKMTNETDHDFVNTMITHHQSAVTMANDELIYGNQAALKELSRNIIEDQTFEINEFKNWQAKKQKL